MKKIKKIILIIIVSLIALISVFSCFKGKYTPEPILTPISVLKPANANNDNVISPTGTYDVIYFNTNLNSDDIIDIVSDVSLNEYIGQYVIYADISSAVFLTLEYSLGPSDDFPNSRGSVYMNLLRFGGVVNGVPEFEIINNFIQSGAEVSFNINLINPFEYTFTNGVSEIDLSIFGLSGVVPVGQQNNLLTNLISPTPFLFEGTSSSIAWTSSGLDNPNSIQNIYFNTNLTNQAIKNVLDTYIGDTSGLDIFYYIDAGVRVRCHVINNSANAFIQIIGGTTILYKWIYNPIDNDDVIWWYGIDPNIIDNGNIIVSPSGNDLNGFNIYELRCLFSRANDFIETPSGDSYEQGYQDGYTAGETAGYNSGLTAGYNNGYTAGETAGYNSGLTAGYNNGYTAGETAGYNNGYTAGETAGYTQGYLDGLDDGAGSNINFQYIESVLNLIGNFLNIEILPNIKLSYALGIVIILSIISIIKMVVK